MTHLLSDERPSLAEAHDYEPEQTLEELGFSEALDPVEQAESDYWQEVFDSAEADLMAMRMADAEDEDAEPETLRGV